MIEINHPKFYSIFCNDLYSKRIKKRGDIYIYTYTYVYLLYFAVHLKLAQHCNPNSILIKNFFKKRKTSKFYFGSKSTKEKDIKKCKRAKQKDTISSTYLTKRIPILK